MGLATTKGFKKDGVRWQPPGGYKAINTVTCHDNYPISHTQEITTSLKVRYVFSRIDLAPQFRQNPVAVDGLEKTVVTAPFVLFEFLRVLYELRSAAQIPHRNSDSTMQNVDFIDVFIAGLIIASSNRRK